MTTRLFPARFSPVAGIQWVETVAAKSSIAARDVASFSPVAGIQWVETKVAKTFDWILYGCLKFQSRCRDSVG